MATSAEAKLDALAVLTAYERGDLDGVRAIVAASDDPLDVVVSVASLAAFMARMYTASVSGTTDDPDPRQIGVTALASELREDILADLADQDGTGG